jgi:hypothetical protein
MRLFLAALAAAGLLTAADQKLGKPLSLKEPMPVAAVLAHADEYVGKTVQIKGKIVDVCEMMGCWMDLADSDGKKIHVKVEDGVIVFPKDSPGKNAVAEGKLAKVELTREQAVERAQEEAKDTGRKFDPDSVKTGTTYYQLDCTGAAVLSK